MSTIADEPVAEEAPARPERKVSRLQAILQLELTPKKVKRRDLMQFCRQLAVFLRAGIPILDGLESLAYEAPSKKLGEILNDSVVALRAGSTFTESLAPHAESLPPYFMGIVQAAEVTGGLDTALDQLSGYVERDYEARRKVVSALTYPIIIATMAVAVVVVLVSFVLPRFQRFFESLNAKLPLATRMLLNVSHFIQHRWYIFVAILALSAVAVFLGITTERGRGVRDTLILRIPVVGDIARYAAVERFCRILGSMMTAGVPLPEAVRVTATATSNVVFRNGILAAREDMLRGAGLARPIADTHLFPPAAMQMMRIGEQTGSLDEQLETAATYFQRELDYRIKNFTDLFEPAVIIAMGGIVAFVAIALVSAMYGIYNQVKL